MDDRSHNPAATSSGSGFFGQTSLLDNDPDAPPLPEDAAEIVNDIRSYFEGILADETMMSAMSGTQSKQISTTTVKILDGLSELFENDKMNHFAYTTLVAIFDCAQNRQYDEGVKLTKDFSNQCRTGKKARFATHRRWVIGWQSILRTAKQFNI